MPEVYVPPQERMWTNDPPHPAVRAEAQARLDKFYAEQKRKGAVAAAAADAGALRRGEMPKAYSHKNIEGGRRRRSTRRARKHKKKTRSHKRR
jgi:hypothetical protein